MSDDNKKRKGGRPRGSKNHEAERAAKAIDVTPKPELEPAAVETKPDLEDGVDGEMA